MKELDLTKILHVGDHVYSLINGEGVVKEINKDYTYPLMIAFEQSSTATYTKEGKYYIGEGETILFPSKEEKSWDNFISSKAYIRVKAYISDKEFINFLKKKGVCEKFLMNYKLPSRIDRDFISMAFRWKDTPEGLNFWTDINSDFVKLFISKTSPEKWTVVHWPEIQELMDLDGFEDNAYLINDEKGMEDFGSSAYFVNENWLKNIKS